ncbi:UppP [Paenibacillus mucilaginosus 3016]|uniref:Undecaprenyl-diphosphatase n=2 Tax=Paenibacillus mucilaginosus TaxID=61624 RepID=H6NCZ9_9BACL|nr:undecaprenyl-diphosphate phosphatase [Paenibacillus mucilaginosus]AFC29481.1 UppP [Paenibacillus mucilaginosus 3016]AFH61659.1 UDP pyrophosphate phosphatase [Paenibacillus mucilaginosus K02]WFA18188.1 undecaprenyl-diphosphate phosphatase [Paenibacillus mucilaginosus]
MSDLWKAVIMGIVEGLTEFLPVSSTGHMILTGHLLEFEGDKASTFKVVIQFGAVLAVLVLYWRRFFGFLRISPRMLERPGLNPLHVGAALVPFLVAGLTIYGYMKKHLFGPTPVLIGLVAGGVLMIAADRFRGRVTAETMDDITYKQAFGIGLFQCLAIWPGFSRSGSSISGGMLLGTSQKAAAEFTFIISVPIMFAASAYDLYKSREFLSIGDLPLFLTGLGTAFLVAMLAIVTFLNLIKRLSLSWFAVYRFVLALVFVIILYF